MNEIIRPDWEIDHEKYRADGMKYCPDCGELLRGYGETSKNIELQEAIEIINIMLKKPLKKNQTFPRAMMWLDRQTDEETDVGCNDVLSPEGLAMNLVYELCSGYWQVTLKDQDYGKQRIAERAIEIMEMNNARDND